MIWAAKAAKDFLPRTGLLPLALLAAACAHQNAAPLATPPARPQAQTSPAALPQAHLDRAVDLLQNGESAEAEQELKACLAEHPDSRAARFLLAQIKTPIAALYPGDSFTVVLGRKDTLSGLAATYLGDPLAFYGLARYNAIAAPGRVVAGQRVRIPRTTAAVAAEAAHNGPGVAVASAPEVSPSPFPPTQSRGTPADSLSVFNAAVKAGRFADAAHVADMGNLKPGKLAAVTLADAYFRAAAAEKTAGDAVAADGHARKAGNLYLNAVRNFELSRAAFLLALSVQANDAAARSGLDTATGKLAAQYFRAAMVAFQHQDLDAAIAAWDRVLALKPADHDAQLNRAQAVQLKANLQKLRG